MSEDAILRLDWHYSRRKVGRDSALLSGDYPALSADVQVFRQTAIPLLPVTRNTGMYTVDFTGVAERRRKSA